MTGERAPRTCLFFFVPPSTVEVLKVRGGGESFCSIKLYCNEVPDGKIRHEDVISDGHQ